MSNKARGSVADSPSITVPKPSHRSRVTNGSALLQNVDGRSGWARRMRDLMALHLSDLGGEAAVSEAEKSLIRRAATLTVELERMEERFANDGEADADALDLYSRTAGNLRRLLEATGLQRRPRDVTPDLRHYIEVAAA
ncbi:hypothetical protein FV219_01565 [Methylobacterium sp. WL122]|nr:hypothetical protein FV219_01565 [Methylobacterium sp. WL122]